MEGLYKWPYKWWTVFFPSLSGVIWPYANHGWLLGPRTVARIHRVCVMFASVASFFWLHVLVPYSRLPNSWQISLHFALTLNRHPVISYLSSWGLFFFKVCCWGVQSWHRNLRNSVFLFGWTSGEPKDCYPKAKTFDPKRFINGIEDTWRVVTVEIPLKGSDPDQRISRDPDQWEGWMNLNYYAEWCFWILQNCAGHWGSMILRVLDLYLCHFLHKYNQPEDVGLMKLHVFFC